MKQLTIYLLILLIVPFTNAQETDEAKPKKVKHYNLVKVGGSIQGDVYIGHNYDYYDSYYYYDNDYMQNPDGYNAVTFVAYEHIWEFPNKMALSIEPKTGVSLRKYSTNFFIGNDLKYYWVNKDIWRMGIALSADYYYGKSDHDVVLRMDDGHYYQRVNTQMNNHFLNFDLSLIPFQFRLKNAPVVFELQFAMIGVGVYFTKTEPIDYPDGSSVTFSGSRAYPYLFKTEFKIGFVLP